MWFQRNKPLKTYTTDRAGLGWAGLGWVAHTQLFPSNFDRELIAWQRGQTISEILIRSALNPPKCPSGNKTCYACVAGVEGNCTTKNVVYEISCVLCPSPNPTYIGETKRQVRLRFNEHLRDAKSRTKDTPLGDHMRNCHPDASITVTSLKLRILRKCRDVASLKITESKYIRDLAPKLNTQTSSWKLIAPPPYGSV